MPWVRFDDQFTIHRKIAGLDDALFRLACESIFWSARNLTDGRIRLHELILVRATATKADADELVARGLWHRAEDVCDSPDCPDPGPDGWVIHDYWAYQPSKAKVLAEREAARQRQRRWREQHRGANGRWA